MQCPWNICRLAQIKSSWFLKRKEIELFVVRWVDLESVIQGEVSQKEKRKKQWSEEPRGKTGIKMQTY